MIKPPFPPFSRGAQASSKVPHVTLAFWLIKILATTFGETGGDATTMTLNRGYAVGSLIFLGFFAVTLAVQVAAKRYHPFVWGFDLGRFSSSLVIAVLMVVGILLVAKPARSAKPADPSTNPPRPV